MVQQSATIYKKWETEDEVLAIEHAISESGPVSYCVYDGKRNADDDDALVKLLQLRSFNKLSELEKEAKAWVKRNGLLVIK